MNRINNILAAVSEFPLDAAVVVRAAEIALEHSAKLTVIHVVEKLSPTHFTDADQVELQQQLAIMSRERIEKAVAKYAGTRDDIAIRIDAGSASSCVSDLASEIKADLIIMRANHKKSLLDLMIGSTTDRVIRSSRAVSCCSIESCAHCVCLAAVQGSDATGRDRHGWFYCPP